MAVLCDCHVYACGLHLRCVELEELEFSVYSVAWLQTFNIHVVLRDEAACWFPVVVFFFYTRCKIFLRVLAEAFFERFVFVWRSRLPASEASAPVSFLSWHISTITKDKRFMQSWVCNFASYVYVLYNLLNLLHIYGAFRWNIRRCRWCCRWHFRRHQ